MSVAGKRGLMVGRPAVKLHRWAVAVSGFLRASGRTGWYPHWQGHLSGPVFYEPRF